MLAGLMNLPLLSWLKLTSPTCSWCWLLMHCVSRAEAWRFDTDTKSSAMRMAMIAMTTSSSTSEKPGFDRDRGRGSVRLFIWMRIGQAQTNDHARVGIQGAPDGGSGVGRLIPYRGCPR